MCIITTQNVMYSCSMPLPLRRINTQLHHALTPTHSHRTTVTNQLLRWHQLLSQSPLLLSLLTYQTTTSRIFVDSDNASRCLKCSQLKSYFCEISFSNSVFNLRIYYSLRPLALGSSSLRNTLTSMLFSSNLNKQEESKENNQRL